MMQCSWGYKVVRCGTRQSTDDKIESTVNHAFVYPDAATNSCIMNKNELGLEIYATCVRAEKIRNYQIVKASGDNTFYAKCPKGLSVFGCGYFSPNDKQDDYYYSVHSKIIIERGISYMGCEAYNGFGADVYAICGNFV